MNRPPLLVKNPRLSLFHEGGAIAGAPSVSRSLQAGPRKV
jgi:hypothetical protein